MISGVARPYSETCHVPDADGAGVDGKHDGNRLGHLSGGLNEVEEGVKITSTFMRTSSSASSGSWSTFSAHRHSMTTLVPSL
jgi:hypothetical protein